MNPERLQNISQGIIAEIGLMANASSLSPPEALLNLFLKKLNHIAWQSD